MTPYTSYDGWNQNLPRDEMLYFHSIWIPIVGGNSTFLRLTTSSLSVRLSGSITMSFILFVQPILTLCTVVSCIVILDVLGFIPRILRLLLAGVTIIVTTVAWVCEFAGFITYRRKLRRRCHGNIVITGCSSGIGKDAAGYLASRGFTVFAAVRKESDAEVLSRLKNDKIIPLLMDVQKEDQIEKAAEKISSLVGNEGLYGLINNAGMSPPQAPVEGYPSQLWNDTIDVNLTGTLRVTAAFLPLIRKCAKKNGSARIVMISSSAGWATLPLAAAYHASKWGLEGLTGVLRKEVAGFDIKVSVINPGVTATPLFDKVFAKGRTPEKLLAHLPLEAQEAYSHIVRTMQKGADIALKDFVTTEPVVKCIEHALIAPQPKHSYGLPNSKGVQLLCILPQWLGDFLSRAALKPGDSPVRGGALT